MAVILAEDRGLFVVHRPCNVSGYRCSLFRARRERWGGGERERERKEGKTTRRPTREGAGFGLWEGSRGSLGISGP